MVSEFAVARCVDQLKPGAGAGASVVFGAVSVFARYGGGGELADGCERSLRGMGGRGGGVGELDGGSAGVSGMKAVI